MGDIGEHYHQEKQKFQTIKIQRETVFIDYWLPLFKKYCEVYLGSNNQYVFDSVIGVLDFYPKSNRLLIRAENKWLNNGLEYLKQKLL
jgi:hypothetical protein